jgi:hypothetical protein
VTTLFGTVAETTAVETLAPNAPKKHGWLPFLTILFMISYGLMTMLIVEQGRTIESQRALIRELFRDSTELSAVKLKAQQEAQAAAAQNPSAQAQNRQTPSSQAIPQQRALNQGQPKSQIQMPSRPASDLEDARRTLILL